MGIFNRVIEKLEGVDGIVRRREDEAAKEAMEYATSITRKIESSSKSVALCGNCGTIDPSEGTTLDEVRPRRDGRCLHCGSKVVWVEKSKRFNAALKRKGIKPMKFRWKEEVELAVSR